MHSSPQLRATPALAGAGSEATFITEHQWGNTRQREGGTLEYEVALRAREAAEGSRVAVPLRRRYATKTEAIENIPTQGV